MFSVDSASFEENDVSCSITSAFATPVDSYQHLYLESASHPAVLRFISTAHYKPSSLTIVPVDDRPVNLTVRLEDREWVRLKDGSMGFVLTVDQEAAQANLLVAVPPRLHPIDDPKGAKSRRLYTIDDMRILMRRSKQQRFHVDRVGTHRIITNSGAFLRFCGPLQLTSIPVDSCTSVRVPNPFDLSLFFEATASWPSLLKSLCDSNFDTSAISSFDSFSFMTATHMHRLGHLYAVESLQANDRVQVTYLLEETDPPMIGSVRSLDEGYVSVYFPLTQLTQLIPNEHTTRLFEPLDLVEVYIGDHTGLRGMVMFVDRGEAFIQDENDMNSEVSYMFLFFILRHPLTRTRFLFILFVYARELMAFTEIARKPTFPLSMFLVRLLVSILAIGFGLIKVV